MTNGFEISSTGILLNSQFCEPDDETAISIKSMQNLESTSPISKIEEKSETLLEKDDNNSDFKLKKHDQTISNHSHDYDDETSSKQSELPEDFSTDTNEQTTLMLKKQNGQCSNYLMPNEGLDDKADKNACRGLLRTNSTLKSSENGYGGKMDNSINFKNSFQRHGSSNQMMHIHVLMKIQIVLKIRINYAIDCEFYSTRNMR